MLDMIAEKLRRAPVASDEPEAAVAESPELDPVEEAGWKARFRAWWEGEDYEPSAEDEVPHGVRAPDAAQPVESWGASRRAIVQTLWGDGFVTPGEAEHVMDLIKPLGLNAKQSAVDIGCGLGGSTRTLAEQTGAWATGLEADADLVSEGNEVSVMAGLGKKAPVTLFKPPTIDLRDRSMDVMISKEAFYTIEDKDTLLDEVYRVLKSDGQLIFTDFVLPGAGTQSSALEAWYAAETPNPVPWSEDQTVEKLTGLGLEVRLAEDVTATLRGLVMRGWKRLMEILSGGDIDESLLPAVVAEVELWARRMALFDSHEMRCYRFYATKHEQVYR
ncbi:MAG: class I SAM-dependent methyltransferase [Alphaproteobacteria bacterium]|jgi:SAM-dependent methyltransferase|nr:class I SAM-dependent methyltransferase [Alphaproteobacteria bacterium]